MDKQDSHCPYSLSSACTSAPVHETRRTYHQELHGILHRGQVNGSGIGKLLGFGLLYGPDESPILFVKDVLSTALCTVAEKKGIKTNVQHITL